MKTSERNYYDELIGNIDRHRGGHAGLGQTATEPVRHGYDLYGSLDLSDMNGASVPNQDGLSCPAPPVLFAETPLKGQLAAESEKDRMVCPECHGTKIVQGAMRPVTCPRCKGSGKIDPFELGILATKVSGRRDES